MYLQILTVLMKKKIILFLIIFGTFTNSYSQQNSLKINFDFYGIKKLNSEEYNNKKGFIEFFNDRVIFVTNEIKNVQDIQIETFKINRYNTIDKSLELFNSGKIYFTDDNNKVTLILMLDELTATYRLNKKDMQEYFDFYDKDLKIVFKEHLEYNCPSNWTKNKVIQTENNITYGCTLFDVGKVAEFSVIEINNFTDVLDAQELSFEDTENLILNLFSKNSKIKIIENKKYLNINSKYAKANAITSKGIDLTTMMHLIIHKSKIIIIQGIYTTKDESEFLNQLDLIFINTKLTN